MAVPVLSTLQDLDVVKVMVPYYIDDKAFFDLHGGVGRIPLLVQTPVCVLRYKYNLYDDGFFSLDLYCTQSKFKDFLDKLMSMILTRVRRKYHGLFNKRMVSQLITDEGKLRLKTPNVDMLSVFDHGKQKVELQQIQKTDRLQALFQIEKLVVDTKIVYFQTKLLQLKKNVVVVNNDLPMFKEEAHGMSTSVLERFRKMLKMGVPIMAVRQKMTMEGHTEQEIAEVCGLGVRKGGGPPPPPPPGPPPPPPLRLGGMGGPPPFLKDIASGNFDLKKAAERVVVPKAADKVLKFVDRSKMVPTLQEILDAKAKLGKNKSR